jgi:serine/threonine-protein phosphatase 2A regulatory subunit A
VNSLGTIAIALGPERSRNELLPYILELLEDDEEVLVALSETLGNFLDHVGGPA